MNQNYRLEHLEYNHQNQKPNPYIDKYIFHNQKGIKQYLYPITVSIRRNAPFTL